MKINRKTNRTKAEISHRVFCLINFFLFSSFVFAQEIAPAQNFHRWGAVTLFNGLPSDSARGIAQTADGVLWFGTDNGLARFDGRRVQTFALDGLESNRINALKSSVGDVLLIGTDDGAGWFRDGKFTALPETRGKKITAIMPGETIIFAAEDTIFAGHFEPDNTLAVVKILEQDLQFSAIDRRGEDYFFGSRGRGIVAYENGQAKEVMSRPRPYFVNALLRDSKGNLWLGADAREGGGLFAANDIFHPRRVGENFGAVTAIAESNDGDLWVGTENRGLFHFRGERQIENFTFENTAGGLRSNTIYTIFADRENVVWLGTNRGISRLDPSSPFNQTLAENGNSNFIRQIFEDENGEIFAGTNRGAFRFDGENWRELPAFSGRIVYQIAENNQRQILFATDRGVLSPDGKTILAGDARALANFQNRTFAAMPGSGVFDIENETAIFTGDAATALFADDRKLRIGTGGDGVFSFDGTKTGAENSLAELRGAAIWKIAEGARGDFWFAGERGLYHFENGRLENLIAGKIVRDVVAEGADVWAATLSDGIIHLKSVENFGWITAGLAVEQGLPSEQIFSVAPVENRLFIGTNRGVSIYAPDKIAPQIIVARVTAQKNYTAEEIAGKINLEYPQNSILIEVAGVSSRTFPEQFQYAFTLRNANGAILDRRLSADAQFAPTDLPAGNYTIEAKVFGGDLLASAPVSIVFSVARAPFPLTATALGVLLAIALVALVWAMIERRRISFRNRELARARFDLANEAERERRRIARDLHDQTLADLRGLMLMSDKLPVETTDFRREIESVSTEIRRICEDLSPSVLENVGLAPALEFLLQHTFENYRFSAAENLEENLHFSTNAQMQIYRIAQEVLTNIKRHSAAKIVAVNININSANEFILTVSDDGEAFQPPEKPAKGRGISNIKSRAALIKADVSWRENADGGTTFTLASFVSK